MNSVESFLLSYLVNSLWQLPLLFCAAWLAARLLRPLGATAEHRVWVSSLLLQVLLPALSVVSRDWLQTLIPSLLRSGHEGDAHVSTIMGPASVSGGLHMNGWLSDTVAITYAASVIYFLARFIWRARSLARLRREAIEIEITGEAAACWSRSSKRFGIHDASIAASARVFGPVTMGLYRKLVLLPASMISDLPSADLHTIIAHEFAHMRRKDFLKNLLYEWLALPISYHPFLWLTRERIIESREMICDRMAAESSGKQEYARSLLRLASLLLTGTSARAPHVIGIFDANEFERRLMKLTETQTEVHGMRRFAIIALCSVVGLATSGSALAFGMHVDAAAAGSQESSTSVPKKLEVKSGVMAGNKIGGSNPVYPAAAKKAKIQGKVMLDAMISKEGTIENLKVISGPKELQASSLDAVRDWTYKPYLLNGDPVEVETTINIIYSLAK
jgi:TonB family protein